jgi:hypothetical protein
LIPVGNPALWRLLLACYRMLAKYVSGDPGRT